MVISFKMFVNGINYFEAIFSLNKNLNLMNFNFRVDVLSDLEKIYQEKIKDLFNIKIMKFNTIGRFCRFL